MKTFGLTQAYMAGLMTAPGTASRRMRVVVLAGGDRAGRPEQQGPCRLSPGASGIPGDAPLLAGGWPCSAETADDGA